MLLDYRCPACGLEGHVSAGPDSGMEAATVTIYCVTCDRLEDVVVIEENAWAPDAVPTEPRCSRRKRHPIKVWSKDDPCPRCGQALLEERPDGAETIWD